MANSRLTYAASGTFVAVPTAFPQLDPRVQGFLKMPFMNSHAPNDHPLKQRTTFDPSVMLCDFQGVDPKAMDFSTVARDAKILASAVQRDPEGIRRAMSIMGQRQVTAKDLETVTDILEPLGLTEAASVREGGGLWPVLILAALAVGASCSAHCSAKKTSPNNPTDVR
ncbi:MULTISPECIES: hypothetical protein [Streptomyces]|uniref:hypothetical protein n=1 Tax=Streptomyces TaxID=1883 RepID=UPI0007CD51B0|nr:hypothetical protein A4V12_31835 [Streptomyces noursei]